MCSRRKCICGSHVDTNWMKQQRSSSFARHSFALCYLHWNLWARLTDDVIVAETGTGHKLASSESCSMLGKEIFSDKDFVDLHRPHWDCWEERNEDAASFKVKNLFYFWKLNHFESANAVT